MKTNFVVVTSDGAKRAFNPDMVREIRSSAREPEKTLVLFSGEVNDMILADQPFDEVMALVGGPPAWRAWPVASPRETEPLAEAIDVHVPYLSRKSTGSERSSPGEAEAEVEKALDAAATTPETEPALKPAAKKKASKR